MTKSDRRYLLATNLAWFISLRWITGTVVCLAGFVDRCFIAWYPDSIEVLAVGFVILIYNALLRAGLMQRQGGWIDVQSQVGVGTTMTIHLPAVMNTAAVPVR